ncbi:hypothetical protein EBZ97_05245 [bacterium]|nr:hypothetical protein [bacterium]
MSEDKSSSRFKKIARGLGTVILVFLLLFQLLILWVANNQIPVRLPESVSQIILHQAAQEGIKLQARNFWIQPDLNRREAPFTRRLKSRLSAQGKLADGTRLSYPQWQFCRITGRRTAAQSFECAK